jgi:transcriptional antiterminator RfaH
MNALTPCLPAADVAQSSLNSRARAPECGSRWHAAQTHPQAERWAEANLKQQGFETCLPMVTERRPDRVTPSMVHLVEVPLFPRYVFVKFDRNRTPWGCILSTRGVATLLCLTPHCPTPIRPGVVERLIATADERRIIKRDVIQEGQAVKIIAGPFADHEGVCLWSSEERVEVMMTCFGRASKTTLDRAQVRER